MNGVHPEAADRRWAVVAVAGAAVAAISIPLAAAAGGPYLSVDHLSPWLVIYAIGLFAALFAAPFLIRDRLGGRLEADARWERALLLWALLAIALFGVGMICGLAGGFASDSLAGSFGFVTAVEAGLVLGVLTVWLMSG